MEDRMSMYQVPRLGPFSNRPNQFHVQKYNVEVSNSTPRPTSIPAHPYYPAANQIYFNKHINLQVGTIYLDGLKMKQTPQSQGSWFTKMKRGVSVLAKQVKGILGIEEAEEASMEQELRDVELDVVRKVVDVEIQRDDVTDKSTVDMSRIKAISLGKGKKRRKEQDEDSAISSKVSSKRFKLSSNFEHFGMQDENSFQEKVVKIVEEAIGTKIKDAMEKQNKEWEEKLQQFESNSHKKFFELHQENLPYSRPSSHSSQRSRSGSNYQSFHPALYHREKHFGSQSSLQNVSDDESIDPFSQIEAKLPTPPNEKESTLQEWRKKEEALQKQKQELTAKLNKQKEEAAREERSSSPIELIENQAVLSFKQPLQDDERYKSPAFNQPINLWGQKNFSPLDQIVTKPVPTYADKKVEQSLDAPIQNEAQKEGTAVQQTDKASDILEKNVKEIDKVQENSVLPGDKINPFKGTTSLFQKNETLKTGNNSLFSGKTSLFDPVSVSKSPEQKPPEPSIASNPFIKNQDNNPFLNQKLQTNFTFGSFQPSSAQVTSTPLNTSDNSKSLSQALPLFAPTKDKETLGVMVEDDAMSDISSKMTIFPTSQGLDKPNQSLFQTAPKDNYQFGASQIFPKEISNQQQQSVPVQSMFGNKKLFQTPSREQKEEDDGLFSLGSNKSSAKKK